MSKKRDRLCASILAGFMALSLLLPSQAAERSDADISVASEQSTDSEVTLSDPQIMADSSMNAGQKVTWDCVWFGSYPQTEIVEEASACGTYGKDWERTSDYEVNESLYSQLSSASGWNSNGDITLNGTKYRRIQRSDATYSESYSSDYYDWSNTTASYHYFRYDPIKWRVLEVNGDQALLLADEGLDDQIYGHGSMTWAEESTLRSWLNGYGSSANTYGTDYSSKNFIDSAFSSEEAGAILSTELDNSTTGPYSARIGGENTSDKVYLLSAYDLYDSDASARYGFYKEDYWIGDEGRFCQASCYAKAMGAKCLNNNCFWWLRSPGYQSGYVQYVDWLGSLDIYGTPGNEGLYNFSVRPALHMNLSSSNLYRYAGTVSSDGTMNEIGGSTEASSDTSTDNLLINYKNDVWNFTNPTDQLISRKVYTDMFGAVKGSLLYTTGLKGKGGLCYGMSHTVLASYLGYPAVSSYGASKLWNVGRAKKSTETKTTAIDFIKHAFVYMYSVNAIKDEIGRKNDFDGLYEAVQAFQNKEGPPVGITIKYGAFHKSQHEIAALGILEENDEYTKIRVYDSNYPGWDISLCLFGTPGHFTSVEYQLDLHDGNGGRKDDLYSNPDTYFYYNTITADMISAYKDSLSSQHAGSVQTMSTDDEEDHTLVCISEDASGRMSYQGESVEIGDWENSLSSNMLSFIPATEEDAEDMPTLCWLTGQESALKFSDLSQGSTVSVAGTDQITTVMAKKESDITFDEDNSLNISTSDDSDVNVSYDSFDEDRVYTTSISGSSTGDASFNRTSDGYVISGVDGLEVACYAEDYTYDSEGNEEVDHQDKGWISVNDLDTDSSYKVEVSVKADGAVYAISADDDHDGVYETLVESKDTSSASDTESTEHVHTWSSWNITKKATCLAIGLKRRTCSGCGQSQSQKIAKLSATVKLSASKKTLKKKKSYTLKITKLAAGDSVISVKASKKSLVKIKKIKKNQYKITAKKKGKTYVTVTLKSGKKAKCKITVK